MASEQTQDAYAHIIAAIACHAWTMAEGERVSIREFYEKKYGPTTRPVYFHSFMSAFEEVADTLSRLGILRGSVCYEFTCDLDQCHENALRNMKYGPNFDQLLLIFGNLFGEYGTRFWGFSTTLETPFVPRSELIPALDALVSLGYARKALEGYYWLEIMAKRMSEAGYWTPIPTGPALRSLHSIAAMFNLGKER